MFILKIKKNYSEIPFTFDSVDDMNKLIKLALKEGYVVIIENAIREEAND